MDNYLNQLYSNREGIFQERTIVLESEIGDLKNILEVVVSFLDKNRYLSELWLNEDWHEHDGFIKESTAISAAELKNLLMIDLDKELTLVDDAYVKLLVYDRNLNFVLRVGNDYNLKDAKCLDITLSKANSTLLKQELEASFPYRFSVKDAAEFFTANYHG